MNLRSRRCSAWWSAAASAVVLLALALGGCGKEEAPPELAPAARAASDASSAIGRIHAMEGDVRIVGTRGEERAQVGVVVDRSETVRTMANAWALIAMLDGATITVRADTEMRFDDYRYDPDGEAQQNTASISIVKGALRSITGLIGQSNPAGYQIKTPTATIGIRGTDHEPAYYPPPPPGQKAEHPPGTYDKVNTGETVIRRPAGEVAVRRGQTAYAPVEVKARPQLLAAAPVFYQRHAEVDRRVVDRREEFSRQFAEQQQRRQQERERQRQLEEQKRREAGQKQRLDDQKKKLDERAKQQETLKKKQEDQKREREKKQADLKKKQEEDRREREKKQAEAKKKREEAKKDQKKDEPDKAKAKDARQQQREQQQQKQQQQREQQQQRQQQQRQQQQREQQQRQQQQQQQQQQRLQQQREQQQQRQLQQQMQQQQRQQQQQQRQPDRGGREK